MEYLPIVEITKIVERFHKDQMGIVPTDIRLSMHQNSMLVFLKGLGSDSERAGQRRTPVRISQDGLY